MVDSGIVCVLIVSFVFLVVLNMLCIDVSKCGNGMLFKLLFISLIVVVCSMVFGNSMFVLLIELIFMKCSCWLLGVVFVVIISSVCVLVFYR